ncbi:MAG: GNAT family N-acetyltransferase [Actinomycetota bacterium]
MELIDAGAVRQAYTTVVPEFVWSTGPVSYEYHFGDRDLFDKVVGGSWLLDGSLFGADTTTLAVDDGRVLGIEIGMPGTEFAERQAGLAPVWQQLMSDGDVDWPAVKGVLQRSERASWLNPVVRADTYYIHAIAVAPEARGTGLGYRLIQNAITGATEAGFKKLQLDVLSDNPAVSFYESVGLELLADTRAPEPMAFGVPPEYRMGMVL